MPEHLDVAKNLPAEQDDSNEKKCGPTGRVIKLPANTLKKYHSDKLLPDEKLEDYFARTEPDYSVDRKKIARDYLKQEAAQQTGYEGSKGADKYYYDLKQELQDRIIEIKELSFANKSVVDRDILKKQLKTKGEEKYLDTVTRGFSERLSPEEKSVYLSIYSKMLKEREKEVGDIVERIVEGVDILGLPYCLLFREKNVNKNYFSYKDWNNLNFVSDRDWKSLKAGQTIKLYVLKDMVVAPYVKFITPNVFKGEYFFKRDLKDLPEAFDKYLKV